MGTLIITEIPIEINPTISANNFFKITICSVVSVKFVLFLWNDSVIMINQFLSAY